MRAWDVVGKHPIYTDGEITHTEIAIASTTGGYATYTERVAGNQLNKTDNELVEMAKEAHFKSEYADRAMAESVQKIDELEISIKQNKTLNAELREQLDFAGTKIAQIDESLERSNAQYTRVEEMMKMTTAMVNELIATVTDAGEEDVEEI
ncbi:DUF1366 domain-containing protein [Streptococcus suis]|nr:DUF1366 domain-containing protein [Streptococcus suis]NQK18047.1 DUF1366 domain-containing protein [Streptococcus suis]